jgi:NADH-quinone oxidoreductase subunit L
MAVHYLATGEYPALEDPFGDKLRSATVGNRSKCWSIGPDGVAARVVDITNRVVRLQTGYIYHYAFVMLIGVALIITYFIFAGGGLPR